MFLNSRYFCRNPLKLGDFPEVSGFPTVYRFFPGEPISTKSGITGITPIFCVRQLVRCSVWRKTKVEHNLPLRATAEPPWMKNECTQVVVKCVPCILNVLDGA